MNLSDHDFELLDRYLDGDLSDGEMMGLEARLKSDPAMSGELSRMREHRSLRAEAFASFEASDIESQQLQWYVRGALARDAATPVRMSFAERAGRWAGGLSRVAAVLVCGFVVGYGFRGDPRSNSVDSLTANPGFIPERPLNAAGLGGGATPSGIVPIGNSATPVGYEVALTDQFGNVVATQQFRTLQEARDFTSDLGKWQQKHRQVQTNGVRLIGDDF